MSSIEDLTTRPYRVMVNGTQRTLLLSDADAKRLDAQIVPAKLAVNVETAETAVDPFETDEPVVKAKRVYKRRAPANKARIVENK